MSEKRKFFKRPKISFPKRKKKEGGGDGLKQSAVIFALVLIAVIAADVFDGSDKDESVAPFDPFGSEIIPTPTEDTYYGDETGGGASEDSAETSGATVVAVAKDFSDVVWLPENSDFKDSRPLFNDKVIVEVGEGVLAALVRVLGLTAEEVVKEINQGNHAALILFPDGSYKICESSSGLPSNVEPGVVIFILTTGG